MSTASRGYITCLRLFFQQGLIYSSPHTTFGVIENAIVGSIEGNHSNCMNYIYAKYAKKIPTRIHLKAITTASSMGRTNCLRNLLEMTTFANVYQNESTALTKALTEVALNGHDECIDLLRFKLDLNLQDKPELYVAPLINNVMSGNCKGLQRLFQLGATPNVTSSETVDYWDLGQTLLTKSERRQLRRKEEDNPEVIPLLLAVNTISTLPFEFYWSVVLILTSLIQTVKVLFR